jgi:hypothetical protein
MAFYGQIAEHVSTTALDDRAFAQRRFVTDDASAVLAGRDHLKPIGVVEHICAYGIEL